MQNNSKNKNTSQPTKLIKERVANVQSVFLNILLVVGGILCLIVLFWIVVIVVKLILGE